MWFNACPLFQLRLEGAYPFRHYSYYFFLPISLFSGFSHVDSGFFQAKGFMIKPTTEVMMAGECNILHLHPKFSAIVDLVNLTFLAVIFGIAVLASVVAARIVMLP